VKQDHYVTHFLGGVLISASSGVLCMQPLHNRSAYIYTKEYTILCLLFKVSLSMTLASEIKRKKEREKEIANFQLHRKLVSTNSPSRKLVQTFSAGC
jgi:hypothetical protein